MLFHTEITNERDRDRWETLKITIQEVAYAFGRGLKAGSTVKLGPVVQHGARGASFNISGVAANGAARSLGAIIPNGMPEADVYLTWDEVLGWAGVEVEANDAYLEMIWAANDLESERLGLAS